MRIEPTRVYYSVIDGRGELEIIKEGRAHEIEFHLTPELNGYLALGGAVVKLTRGTASLNLSLLDEGILTPTVASDGKIELEPISYKSGRITSVPLGDEYIRRLRIRVERLENKLSELEKSTRVLEDKVGTQLIL